MLGIAVINTNDDESIEKIINQSCTPRNETTTTDGINVTELEPVTNEAISANKPVRLFHFGKKEPRHKTTRKLR